MSQPFTGNANSLQFRPGVKFQNSTPVSNWLTFALGALVPPRVSPRMLEGLRRPTNPLAGMGSPAGTEPNPLLQGGGALTQEQMAAIALQQAMALRQ